MNQFDKGMIIQNYNILIVIKPSYSVSTTIGLKVLHSTVHSATPYNPKPKMQKQEESNC